MMPNQLERQIRETQDTILVIDRRLDRLETHKKELTEHRNYLSERLSILLKEMGL